MACARGGAEDALPDGYDLNRCADCELAAFDSERTFEASFI
ncbi:MAG TPA: hypothetical protein VKP30_25965 [Polyangiaceae bacterium]|nr:hypothetical protein [Polyangiaceae bacterium]